YCFFFQAEDGIRDRNVTGVQTCALPISLEVSNQRGGFLMRKFLLFLAGLTAAILFLVHLGPMILLGVSIWLVYLVFKQFIKAETTLAKVGWVVLGLFILSIGISNI